MAKQSVRRSPSLSQALQEYAFATNGLSLRTQEWYTQKLAVFREWCADQGMEDLENVDHRLVRRFQAHLRGTRSARTLKPISSYTLHGYVQVVKGFLSWCAEDGLLEGVNTRAIDMPKVEEKVIHTFTRDQLHALFEATRKEPTAALAWRDRAFLSILLDTGVRASELCHLTLDHVHLSDRHPYIQVLGKGKKERQVGLGKGSRQTLARYLHQHRHAADGVAEAITGRYGQGLTVYGVDSILYRLRDWAGPDLFRGIRVSAHTFRHTFAVNYLQAGGDVYTLSRLLGHTSVMVTEVYLKDFKQRQARSTGISVLDQLA